MDTCEEIVRDLASRAPDAEFIPADAFAAEPPAWAVWEDMGMGGDQCGRCGSWCEVVRPGKTQCPACGDDDLAALALRARKVIGELEAKR